MKLLTRSPAASLLSAAVLTLAGCGGGSTSSPTVVTPATITLVGTAATGAALSNATVNITDSSGTTPCQETAITTTALGSYTCTLQSGKTAPFFVVVTDPTGNTPPMVSVATQTPTAGTALTVNVTPLTTAIVAQLATDGDPLSVVSSRTVDAAALTQITTNVVAQLADVLTSIGAPTDYNPFTTSITAATAAGAGNTADLILDVVKVVTDPTTGELALTTIDNPTPIALATATTSGAPVAAPDSGVSTLSQAVSIAAKAFNACFAVPTSSRVLGTAAYPQSEGGLDVQDVATACQDMVADSANAAGIDYMHNGYSAGQQFYGLLTTNSMTGAQFSAPEIMAFYPADDSAAAGSPAAYDRAILNIRYLDANGNPGNVITVASNLPGTSSAGRPTSWWLTGNQQAVDTSVRLNIRRVEQLNPAFVSTANSTRFSTYQAGMQFNVNAKGPGSINADGTLTFARVTGPGLPAGGLVYKTSTNTSQASMDLFNKTGSLSTGAQCGNGTTFNCPNLWFTRTAGTSGTAAATLTANPTSFLWAQPSDAVDTSQIVKGARYQIELFYGANTTTPGHSVTKVLLSDLVPTTLGANLPWNTLGPKSLAAFDPSGSLAGVQTSSLEMDWVQNTAAQQISTVQPVINATNGSFGTAKTVPRGATSVVLDNPDQIVPAFATDTGSRTVLFGYRMTDGSSKTAVYMYN